MSCYIHGDGTFDLKIRAVVVWGGGNLYNLDEVEKEMIFYKTIKNFFSIYSVLEKSVYHLIAAISVELPQYSRGKNIQRFYKKYSNKAYSIKISCGMVTITTKMSSSFNFDSGDIHSKALLTR